MFSILDLRLAAILVALAASLAAFVVACASLAEPGGDAVGVAAYNEAAVDFAYVATVSAWSYGATRTTRAYEATGTALVYGATADVRAHDASGTALAHRATEVVFTGICRIGHDC